MRFLERKRHHLVGESGGGEVVGVKAFNGRIFHEIHADYGSAFGELREEVQGLVPEKAAGDRCSGGGHNSGVQTVDVEGDVDLFWETLGKEFVFLVFLEACLIRLLL